MVPAGGIELPVIENTEVADSQTRQKRQKLQLNSNGSGTYRDRTVGPFSGFASWPFRAVEAVLANGGHEPLDIGYAV
jgi:hypothetical protein